MKDITFPINKPLLNFLEAGRGGCCAAESVRQRLAHVSIRVEWKFVLKHMAVY
jgi:hypothetical protein